MAIRFTKIKYDGSQVEIHYEKGAEYADKYTLKCSEPPRPELGKAFMDLGVEVINLCELPDDYLSRIIVRSVSLNYSGKNETMGATITAQMELYNSNCPLNINTPNKPVEPYNADCDYDDKTYAKTCLSCECVDKLEELIEEAGRYVDGQRAQGKLFDDKNPAA